MRPLTREITAVTISRGWITFLNPTSQLTLQLIIWGLDTTLGVLTERILKILHEDLDLDLDGV